MICVPVAPESRTLGRVDLLNAARAADMVELCLDRFVHTPDVRELITGLGKPVIVSCRRRKDGGHFEGPEADRLNLLKNAIAAGPAMIELELEIASRIPRTVGTSRLVSINRPFRALTDIAELLAQAGEVDADVIKFVWPGMLLDSLQPVLTELLTHPKIPIVGLPIGYGARMFGVLARKLNAPWIYAALEQGMEIYDGMPTVRELDEKYRIREVTPQTRFIGVVGFGETRERLLQAFNAGFQELDLNFRALPLEVGPVDTLKRQLEQLEIPALIATPGMGDYILPLVDHPEPAAALPRHVDLLLQKRDGWHGYNLLWRSLLKVVERMLHRQHPAPLSLESTRNLVIGGGPIARSILFGLKQLKGTSLLTIPGAQDEVAFCPGCGEALVAESSPDDIAAALDSRAIPYRDIISTRPDVLFLADAGLRPGFQPQALNPLYLQPPLVVVDAMSMFQESDLLSEARARGCHVVRPRYVLGEYLSATFRAISGKDLPDAAFQRAMEIA